MYEWMTSQKLNHAATNENSTRKCGKLEKV